MNGATSNEFHETNCPFTFEGQTFVAGGAWRTKDSLGCYLDGAGSTGNVTTWNGETIGTYRVTSSWIRHSSRLGPYRMSAVRVRLADGSYWYGRLNSDWSQLLRARPLKGERP